ncbi:MAG: ABC transporter permease, partial [Desulfurococcales archaeon]|nr:ABC transporter permease [Desulfurococcales archaeon]
MFKALLIFLKDLRQYYSKAPTLSWGILFPITIIVVLGYSIGVLGEERIIPGMISIALLFSSSTMAHVSMGFDRMSGAIDRLIYAPISSKSIVIGKALGGIFFGLIGVGVSSVVIILFIKSIPVINPLFITIGILVGSIIYSLLGVLLASLL